MADVVTGATIAVIADIHGNSWALDAGVWRVEHVALPYDWDAAADCACRNGHDDWAEGIATGRA